jgi:hypothetical protein
MGSASAFALGTCTAPQGVTLKMVVALQQFLDGHYHYLRFVGEYRKRGIDVVEFVGCIIDIYAPLI